MVSRNGVEVNEEKPLFQLFFLKDNENQSVNVEEVEEIDFEAVKKRLENGESVFITLKRKQQFKISEVERKDAAEPWYFTHI
ncbi:MAG: hypothetical protein OEW71_03525 [Candidatus Bathyarchaeota archaeon]|nr:hypothetical protein [Candidatus Bathyarchaeota archaeon]